MAVIKSPFVDPLPSSLRSLSISAAALNTATLRLTKSIEILDSSLKKLNLGISSWIEISSEHSPDERFWSKEELGYAKVNGKWGLALRVFNGDECVTDEEGTSCTEWLFCDAARDLRIRALPHLPRLIVQLNSDAESITSKITERVKEAEELAGAIEIIARSGTSSSSIEQLQQYVITALQNARSQGSASDALTHAIWSLNNDTVQIKTELSKTMLPMVVNAEAEKIIRQTIREYGSEYLKVELHAATKQSLNGESR